MRNHPRTRGSPPRFGALRRCNLRLSHARKKSEKKGPLAVFCLKVRSIPFLSPRLTSWPHPPCTRSGATVPSRRPTALSQRRAHPETRNRGWPIPRARPMPEGSMLVIPCSWARSARARPHAPTSPGHILRLARGPAPGIDSPVCSNLASSTAHECGHRGQKIKARHDDPPPSPARGPNFSANAWPARPTALDRLPPSTRSLPRPRSRKPRS